jgi:hypothetical protein
MTGVAIVIPMLNEAAGLPRLLRSLAVLEPLSNAPGAAADPPQDPECFNKIYSRQWDRQMDVVMRDCSDDASFQ